MRDSPAVYNLSMYIKHSREKTKNVSLYISHLWHQY